MSNLPLIVDLDDTLLRTDTLWEGVWAFLRQNPPAVFKLIWLASRGALVLKQYLAEYSLKNAELFPVNRELVTELENALASGHGWR